MKPFDIELAKAGHPVCTRDERPVRILCYDFITPENNPIVALVKLNEKQEGIVCYTGNGKNYPNGECSLDLMMATEKKEGWVNIYNEGSNKRKSSITIYSTKEEAHLSRVGDCIDTVKIIWEE